MAKLCMDVVCRTSRMCLICSDQKVWRIERPAINTDIWLSVSFSVNSIIYNLCDLQA